MLKKTVLVRALQIAFTASALTLAVTQPVMAQSNASGNIFGQVDSPAGATIVVQNKEIGLKRTITPEASGRFQLSALPVGRYQVELLRDGKPAGSTEVEVQIGQGVNASFTTAAV